MAALWDSHCFSLQHITLHSRLALFRKSSPKLAGGSTPIVVILYHSPTSAMQKRTNVALKIQ